MANPTQPINDVISRFRRLNPDNEPTVVAVSGGADSVALAFCLKLASKNIKLTNVSHDGFRSEEELDADKCLVERLAEQLEVPFTWRRALVSKKGNNEAEARRSRYEELIVSCYHEDSPGIKYTKIATAHHADDQLETLLMRIVRGTGTAGLRGVVESRPLDNASIEVIRPMLGVSKEHCYEICKENNLEWREDETNEDKDYTRNLVRADVVPVLKQINNRAAEHASDLACIMHSTHQLVEQAVCMIDCHGYTDGNSKTVSADALRLYPDVVVFEWLRSAARITGNVGLDKINKKMLDDVVRAIRGRGNKTFEWPSRIVSVTPQTVTVSKS